MKKAKVADLRNKFPTLARWIEDGESVQITRRGRTFAVLSPAGRKGTTPTQWPRFEERLEKVFPDGPVKGRSEETIDYLRGDR